MGGWIAIIIYGAILSLLGIYILLCDKKHKHSHAK